MPLHAAIVSWVYWLFGLPLVFGLAFLLLSQQQSTDTEPYKVAQVEAWTEALPPSATFTQAYFSQLNAQPGNFAQAAWTPVTLPNVIELGAAPRLTGSPPMARVWFKFKAVVPVDIQSTNPLVLYARRAMGGPYAVWVNGELAAAPMDDWRMLWNKPVFVTIPHHLAKPGATLEVAFALPHRVGLGYAMGSMFFGVQSALQPARDVRYLLQMGLPMAGMLMIGITGLFSLGIWVKRRHESAHLWLFLMAVSVIACNLQFTHEISAGQEHSRWFGSLVDSATSWLFLSVFIFAQRYSDHSFPKITSAVAVFTVIITVMTLPVWNWQVSALLFQHYILIAIYTSIMLVLTWASVRYPNQGAIIFGLVLWVMLFAGVHDIAYMTSQLKPDKIWIFPYGAFVLFFVAEYLLRKRYQTALAQVESSVQLLDQRLKAREQEILEQQQQLQRAREQAVLSAERARLSRDIHDGIGSVLTGTLIHLRSKTVSQSQAAEQVQLCLDDIRLVMDSIDQSQSDLPSLLASLRWRFANACDAAGIELVWEMDELTSVPPQAADFVLSVARILQEIVTNCLKHSRSSQLRIQAQANGLVDGVASLTLKVTDDGKGFDASVAQPGRGLQNIRQRMAKLNGEFDIASGHQGTAVTLRIPYAVGK